MPCQRLVALSTQVLSLWPDNVADIDLRQGFSAVRARPKEPYQVGLVESGWISWGFLESGCRGKSRMNIHSDHAFRNSSCSALADRPAALWLLRRERAGRPGGKHHGRGRPVGRRPRGASLLRCPRRGPHRGVRRRAPHPELLGRVRRSDCDLHPRTAELLRRRRHRLRLHRGRPRRRLRHPRPRPRPRRGQHRPRRQLLRCGARHRSGRRREDRRHHRGRVHGTTRRLHRQPRLHRQGRPLRRCDRLPRRDGDRRCLGQ